jgi:hypothetical protein
MEELIRELIAQNERVLTVLSGISTRLDHLDLKPIEVSLGLLESHQSESGVEETLEAILAELRQRPGMSVSHHTLEQPDLFSERPN